LTPAIASSEAGVTETTTFFSGVELPAWTKVSDDAANVMRDALAMPADLIAANEEFEDAGTPAQAELGLPIVNPGESLAHRAEAIRFHLETRLGVERMMALRRELMGEEASEKEVELLKEIPRSVVELAQQLLIIDGEL
jgi:hypothetical protein